MDRRTDHVRVSHRSSWRRWGCFLGTLLLLGGLGFGAVLSLFLPRTITDPDRIRQIQQQILPITLPEFMHPWLAQTLETSWLRLQMTVFRQVQGRGVLRLTSMAMKGQSPAALPQWLRRLTEPQRYPLGFRKLQVNQHESSTLSLPAASIIIEQRWGQDLESATQYVELEGWWHQGDSVTRLEWQLERDVWDDSAIWGALKEYVNSAENATPAP